MLLECHCACYGRGWFHYCCIILKLLHSCISLPADNINEVWGQRVFFGTSSPIVLDKGQLNRLLLMCGNSGIMPCYLGHIGWFILQQIATVLWGHSSLWPHNMQHVLYRFLPELNSHQHSLRPQWHNFSLSIKTDDLIFLVRQLFADSYWCSFALTSILLYTVAFCSTV